MRDYRKRVVDDILRLKLSSSAAVLVEGAKWCGKTTTCQQVARSVIYMDEPERRESNVELARIQPSRILEGARPRLIDEWQIAPQLWDAIRYRADRESIIGGFMITGSAVPVDIDELKHSGTGRFSWLKMRPMSLWESSESSGGVCLGDLRVYAEALGGEVRHYHDKGGLECDAVVHLPNGAYGLVEVKTGGKHLIEQGVGTLRELSSLIEKKGVRAPAFRMVLTAVGEFAYRREDGVLVCPIGCLRP